MKRIAHYCISAILFSTFTFCRGAEDAQLSAIKAADDERVAAILAADRARLSAVFSDELRYAHSSGAVDTKTSYIEALTSGKLKYTIYDYQEKNFTFPAPGIALMSARAHVKAVNNGAENDMVLCILAVWREEQGKWRFLAWQSAKLPSAPPAQK